MNHINLTFPDSKIDTFLNKTRTFGVVFAYFLLVISYDFFTYLIFGPALKIHDTPLSNLAWFLLLFPIGFLVNATCLGIVWRWLKS